MKIHWYERRKHDDEDLDGLEERLLDHFETGLTEHKGDSLSVSGVNGFDAASDADVAICYGLSGRSRKVLDAYRAKGSRVIIFDKGMIRLRNKSPRHRVMIDEGSPLKYMMRTKRPKRRWDGFDVAVEDHQPSGRDGAIILATNSQKHNDFWGIKDGQRYAREVVSQIKALTGRDIIFRPKPKSQAFEPIPGTTFSGKPEHLEDILPGAHVLITHTSSCAINALLMGVPAVCLGRCAASPVSGSRVKDVLKPRYPGEKKLQEWLAALAWFEWSLEEFVSGEAWRFIKSEMRH